MHRCLALFAIIGLCSASVLLTNGDFEQPLSEGWFSSAPGTYSTVERATTYDPDPDYEARAFDSLGSYAKLWQTVAIPTTDLEFSVSTSLDAFDNDADTLCWAGAAITVSYLDAYNTILGQTMICRFTTPCPWTNTSTCHLIVAPNSNWETYSFNVDTELTNLPGVDPDAIHQIEVALYAKTEHTC